jgi:hypothetical protein
LFLRIVSTDFLHLVVSRALTKIQQNFLSIFQILQKPKGHNTVFFRRLENTE